MFQVIDYSWTARAWTNKVSPWRDVTLLARCVLPPGELCCTVECYRCQQTTDDDDKCTVSKIILPPTLCIGGPVIKQQTQYEHIDMKHVISIWASTSEGDRVMLWINFQFWNPQTLSYHKALAAWCHVLVFWFWHTHTHTRVDRQTDRHKTEKTNHK